MRVCCFYTELHPAVKNALSPDAELVYTGGDDHAYWRELMTRWDGSSGLVTVEHDVEIHDRALPAFAACDRPWCVYPYPYFCDEPALAFPNLGCARFSAQCLRDFPDIAERAADFAVKNGLPPEPTWDACDSYIARALITAGLTPHRHKPQVTHHRTSGDWD